MARLPTRSDWSVPETADAGGGRVPRGLDDEAIPTPNRKVPKVIFSGGPVLRLDRKSHKRVQFGYGLNYLIGHRVCGHRRRGGPRPARTYDEVAATKDDDRAYPNRPWD